MNNETQKDDNSIADGNNISIPNLGDVIKQTDVSQKGGGSYKAEYVNWCRTSHLLHEHAPGWQFHIAKNFNGSHVFNAPDGTAYVVGYFKDVNGNTTPEFPQAIMDNRNNAIQHDKVSARDLTDSHRRCLCTAAAAQFGLAWQLWAKEELENPHREEAKVNPYHKRIEPSAIKPSIDYTKLKETLSKYKESIESCESYEELQIIAQSINNEGEAVRKNLRSLYLEKKNKLKPRAEVEGDEKCTD